MQSTLPHCITFTTLFNRVYVKYTHHKQGVSRLVDITTGGDFRGLCDQKCYVVRFLQSTYKHVYEFGWLRSYDRLKLRIDGNDY